MLHLFLLLSASLADVEFDEWATTFDKSYSSLEEHSTARDVWLTNDRYIKEHNARDDQSYQLGHNQFSDLTEASFRALHSGFDLNGMTADEMRDVELEIQAKFKLC